MAAEHRPARIDAPAGTLTPSAHSISALTGRDIRVQWGSNWDDDLADGPDHARNDPDLAGLSEQVRLAFEQVFMFYLPRICEHFLNPSCVASCRRSARRPASAAAQGIPADWLDAARRSPVHALIARHRVALPLHPESQPGTVRDIPGVAEPHLAGYRRQACVETFDLRRRSALCLTY